MEPYEVGVRLLLAIIVGGLIGYEREFKNRPAGFRTHILVSVGATVISLIQIEMIENTKKMIMENPILASSLKADIGRMGAQVITGIGFLGAGTIIREKGLVKGLTTAASVWVVSCIGLAIGLGMYFISLASLIAVLIALIILKRVEKKFIDQFQNIDFEISYNTEDNFREKAQKYFKRKNVKVRNIKYMDIQEDESIKTKYKTTVYTVEVPRYIKGSKIVQDLCQYTGAIEVREITN
ncbi:methyltransferase [Vallitalea longa]|uniref:Methyltransferase n=1 Tax=Vallitalea longa TaxID=2936439 RepID=A0A9W6DDW4_9FIRM|nr:MgtC/SapB family protein [Vallitalea longa]GKX27722.1 methyltransferase [Vallitalea longa]